MVMNAISNNMSNLFFFIMRDDFGLRYFASVFMPSTLDLAYFSARYMPAKFVLFPTTCKACITL